MNVQVVNLSPTDWIIISAMATVIVSMAIFIMRVFNINQEERKEQGEVLKELHETHRIEQKENLTAMITAMAGGTKALESNTKVIDEMKVLINNVRDSINNIKNGIDH